MTPCPALVLDKLAHLRGGSGGAAGGEEQ
eukprot:SAG11_NODE_14555_length_608_cov_0.689587_1_plen_28_part_10